MKIILCLFILLILALIGCTTTDTYRTESDEICEYREKNTCPKSARSIGYSKEGNTYRLNFFEIGDQGDVHLRNQVAKLISEYREIARQKDVLLITFMHGWHHNANGDSEDTNVIEFRKVLAEAADHIEGKEVLGVYIGWRGDSVNVPLLDRYNLINWSSFWDRKSTAHQLASQGLTELLLELETSVIGVNGRNHKMVTIGHSFGGAALYTALQPILSERFVKSRLAGVDSEINGFGDVVVLLNPAFEGMKFNGLFNLAQGHCESYPKTQPPRLVILSSSADWPVRYMFPTGRRINALMETYRPIELQHCNCKYPNKWILDTAYTDRYAVGHNKFYLTHDLEKKSREKKCKLNSASNDVVHESGLTKLTSRSVLGLNSPYLNIWTNGCVMPGHNDIWTTEVKEFLVKITKAIDSNKSLRMMQEIK